MRRLLCLILCTVIGLSLFACAAPDPAVTETETEGTDKSGDTNKETETEKITETEEVAIVYEVKLLRLTVVGGQETLEEIQPSEIKEGATLTITMKMREKIKQLTVEE